MKNHEHDPTSAAASPARAQQAVPGTAAQTPTKTPTSETSNPSGKGSISVQSISLSQGGSAIRGIGETFLTAVQERTQADLKLIHKAIDLTCA